MKAGIRRWIWQGFSLLLAVAILTVLLSRQDWSQFARRLRDVDGRGLAAAAVVGWAYWTVRVARWRWMTRLEATPVGWTRAWVSMLAGLGVGLITPLRGGEVVRPMFVPRGARMRLAGWVVMERMFDLSAVLILCILAIFYLVFAAGVSLAAGGPVPPWLLLVCPPLLAVGLGGPLLVHYRPAGLWRILSRVLPGKAKELAEVRLTRRQFGIFLGVSLLGETLSVLSVYCCLRAFGRINLLTACALSPIVMLHNLLPATPGGFGIRETVAVTVYGLLGFPGEMVLAAYLSNPLIVLVIPGALGVGAAWVSGLARNLRAEAGT